MKLYWAAYVRNEKPQYSVRTCAVEFLYCHFIVFSCRKHRFQTSNKLGVFLPFHHFPDIHRK